MPAGVDNICRRHRRRDQAAMSLSAMEIRFERTTNPARSQRQDEHHTRGASNTPLIYRMRGKPRREIGGREGSRWIWHGKRESPPHKSGSRIDPNCVLLHGDLRPHAGRQAGDTSRAPPHHPPLLDLAPAMPTSIRVASTARMVRSRRPSRDGVSGVTTHASPTT